MSTRYNKGSQYENHPRAAELRNVAEHAAEVGELHGKAEHLTGAEHTRETAEHAGHPDGAGAPATVGHGIAAFGHAEIAALAHELWQARGCPEGSADEDWFRASEQLRARAYSHRAGAGS